MKKLLVVCGPTATGKTSLAIALAKKFNGEIVSADSRQVYRGMDIGTGKEWGDVPIHGYDLVDPKNEYSISKYLKFARKLLGDTWSRKRLPVIVGGTGLYIKGVVDGIPTATVPRNKKLRERLEEKSAGELFESLSQLDALKAGSMNSSDKKNPRRLIRAIEVAQWRLEHGGEEQFLVMDGEISILMIGLTAPKGVQEERISRRVDERLKMGLEGEITELLKSGVEWDDQAMQALGYRQWRDYFEGEVPKDVVVDEWRREEIKYAKRQMVWFKKDKRIKWFDITQSGYQKEVEKLVKKWYSDGHVEED